MITTKSLAEKLYKIVEYINPYECCSMDKKEHIDNLMSLSLEENVEYLKEFIIEGYDSKDLLNDSALLRQYLNIVKYLKKK